MPEPPTRRPTRRPIPPSPHAGGAALVAGLLVLAAGCAPPRVVEAPVAPAIPPVSHVAGELAVDVVHPPAGETVPPVDSTFIFGSVGHGDAALTINGAPVDVHPNGAWLAFLPVPPDGRYELVARLGERVERHVHEVDAAPLPAVDAPAGRPGIVPGTVRPEGDVWIVRGEALEVSVQATPGRPREPGAWGCARGRPQAIPAG